MTSLFDLPQRPSDLYGGDTSTANACYRQVSATKDVTRHQFSQGVQQFRWDTAGNVWFVPKMSYFRMRFSLTQVREDGGEALPVLTKGDLAPNVGLANHLFKSVEVQLQGTTVERITERIPQIAALKMRMGKSKGWMDTVGMTTNFWDADFAARQASVAVDGYHTRQMGREPTYSSRQTQAQAGFDILNTVRYNASTHLATFAENGGANVDILNGAMSLRCGDRLCRNNVVLEIQRVIDPHTALCTMVCNTHGNVNVEEKDEDNNVIEGYNGWDVQRICESQENIALGKNCHEIVFQPPLGFFEMTHAVPPGGSWSVEFNPASVGDYKKAVVQSLIRDLDTLSPGNPRAGQFDFQVEEFMLYLYTVESTRFDSGSWYLDLRNMRCQLQVMPQDSSSLIQKNFDVSGRTSSLTLAFQDISAGNDTRFSRSLFKIRPATANGVGEAAPWGQETMLTRFFVNYANSQKPSPGSF